MTANIFTTALEVSLVVAISMKGWPESAIEFDVPGHECQAQEYQEDESANAINRLITRIVVQSIPHEYNDTKRWGKTEQRWNGVRLRRDGWKLETKRDWTTVNHGTWQKYSAQLIDPDQQFTVELKNIGPTHSDAIGFELVLVTPLTLEARQAQWVNGLQLYSLSADMEAKIRLSIRCELSSRFAPETMPPEIRFEVKATEADLQLESFQVKRISKWGGEFAQQATHWVESHLAEKLAGQGPKIVEKINRQIEDHAADFRVPVGSALASPWAAQLWPKMKSQPNSDGPSSPEPTSSR